jgi:hypothetical protein
VNILQVASTGKAENVVREMRVRSLYSPYYLAKVVLGYKELVDHLHLHDTELFIQRWLEGVRKQWIEWPRGFFKSTTFTISTGIWITLPHDDSDSEYALDVLHIDEGEWFRRMKLHDQDTTQLLAFETQPNAKKKVNEIKWHFEENTLFRMLFPEIAYSGNETPWTTDCLKIRRVGDGRRVQEGTFEAIGVDGALQSRHYKIVWEDDLVGKKAVESQVTMESTIRWHGLLHGAFENAAEQIRFGVSNRWGYADLNSHIRQNEPDFVFYTRRAWEIDEETGTERAIFPERYPLDKLKQIQNSGSMTKYDFSCQYLNDPVLPGEQETDIRKLHTYHVEPDGRIVCSCGASFYASQLWRAIHYDPYNAKQTTSGSCPAIPVVGTSTDKHIFLLDYFIGRGNYPKIYDKLFEYNDRWRPHVFTYEDVGNQNMCEFHIRDREKFGEHLDKHRRFPRIIAVPTRGRAKEIRIRDSFLPCIDKYKFSRRANHLSFDKQLETFPNKVLDHDYDLLDALAQGALVWRFPESDEAVATKKADEDAYMKQLGQPYTQMEYNT